MATARRLASMEVEESAMEVVACIYTAVRAKVAGKPPGSHVELCTRSYQQLWAAIEKHVKAETQKRKGTA